ncbi:MAG: Rid family hydrolase [Paludibacter sp.]
MLFVNYHSFSATCDLFSETVYQLFSSIPKKDRVLTINVFGGVTDDDYLSKSEIIRLTAQQVFGRLPLLSYIAQMPENENTLIAEVGYLADGINTSDVCYHEMPEGRYLTTETDDFSAILIEGMMSDQLWKPIAEQSFDILNKIQKILKTVSMPVENIIRQWNYIGHITAVENNCQNYQEFNNERARFYSPVKWENGFPAATGISMDIHAVIVCLIAVQFHNNSQILPVENSLQLAAYRYSNTLLGKSEKKETPKFERAKLVVNGQSACCFISGTAAILGEQSLTNVTVTTQTSQTIALIRHLISTENLKENGINFSGELKIVHLRIYVKETVDFEAVRQVVEAEFTGISQIYVCAAVCREELLVEIEGVAMTEL